MSSLSDHIIDWQRHHGRHDLPWQNTRDPYAIWVSEIMLQQTQVAAVIPYYQRFMMRFTGVAGLAEADQDEVLQLWSGLGYYSRARNLHAAAQKIMADYGGQFPQTAEAIRQLPGIGRSTAAAIAAFAFGHRGAILDGNVKRVFTRCFGIEGWTGHPAVEQRLWSLAEQLLPEDDIETYSQGLMDLGASLCSRSKPDCCQCPLKIDCIAYRDQRTDQLPTPKPGRMIPERSVTMLLFIDGNEILLEKRPQNGIWGGLWSLPEVTPESDVRQAARERYGLETLALTPLPTLTHTFTHFRLHIKPQPLKIVRRGPEVTNGNRFLWLEKEEAMGAAIPAAVRSLLEQLK